MNKIKLEFKMSKEEFNNYYLSKKFKKLKLVSLEEYKKIEVPKNKIPKDYVNKALAKELYCKYELGIIVCYEKHELEKIKLQQMLKEYYSWLQRIRLNDLSYIKKYYFKKYSNVEVKCE
mgnify:CR=1 FL=1